MSRVAVFASAMAAPIFCLAPTFHVCCVKKTPPTTSAALATAEGSSTTTIPPRTFLMTALCACCSFTTCSKLMINRYLHRRSHRLNGSLHHQFISTTLVGRRR